MATLYAKAAGGNWSSANTWSTTSSAGGDNSGPPLATDDVIFDTGSTGTVTVDTTSCVCKTLTCQSASNKITFTASQILYVSGNVTFFTGMGTNLSGTGNLNINSSGTLTTNGNTIPGSLTFSTGTNVISGPVVVTGLTTFASCTINYSTAQATDTITCNGGALCSGSMPIGASTAKLIVAGGTISSNVSGSYFDIDIDFAGTITTGALLSARTKTIRYVSGTVDTFTNSTILQSNNGLTLNTPTANMKWFSITWQGGTLTLTSAIQMGDSTHSATLTMNGSGTIATSNITLYGNIDTLASGGITGQTITMKGGTWQSTGFTSAYVGSNLNLDGNITISGNVGYRTGTLVWVSGAIVTTTGSTLNLSSSCTLNTPTAGMVWNNINSTAAVILTLTSAITLDGILSVATGASLTLATSNVTARGGVTVTGTGLLAGSGRTVTITGGTWTGTTASSNVTCNITIAGNVNITGYISYSTGTITYSSGTVTNNSNLSLYGSCSMNGMNGMTWYNVSNTATLTLTLNSLLRVTNSFGNGSGNFTIASNDVELGGSLNSIGTGILGTRTITMTGTSGDASIQANFGLIACNLTINAPGQTISFTNNLTFSTGTLRYIAGTMSIGTRRLKIAGSCTLNTHAGVTWYDIETTATATVTLASNLYASSTLILSAATTFTGNYLITCGGMSLGTFTHTLSGPVDCNGNLLFTNAVTLNGSKTINCSGNFTTTSGIVTATGTTVIMDGTGAISTSSGNYRNSINIVINTAGTISNTYCSMGNNSSFVYVAGTFTGSGGLQFTGTVTYNCPPSVHVWGALRTDWGSATVTLQSDLSVTSWDTGQGTTCAFAGAGNIYCTSMSMMASPITMAGNIYINGNLQASGLSENNVFNGAGKYVYFNGSTITLSRSISGGTATFVFKSSCSFSGSWFNAPSIVDCGGGTVTFASGSPVGGSITGYSGTIGGTLSTQNSINLNLGPVVCNANVNVNAGHTVTLTGPFTMATGRTLTINATGVFACGTNTVTMRGNITNNRGIAGITGNSTFIFDGTTTLSGNTNFYNVTINTGKTVHLTSGNVFATTNNFTADGGVLSPITFDTTTPTSSAQWNPSANTTVCFVNATDINSSTGGFTIKDVEGTLLRTTNWSVPATGGICPLPGFYPSM